ncbi:unnamed protein product, partial [Mesorhabditis belari]|uniref:Membrane magnesium transporter n=1 Tax=Mesorhabditis belari TaxID=2138241 RepID=A0AAF3EP92_9BILA
MGASFLEKSVTIAALFSLLHCAYSAAQHRFYLRLTEQPFTHLPLDIVVQTLVSLVALIYGASRVAGTLEPIRADIQNRRRTWDEVGSCLSFSTFDHRSRMLSPIHSALRQDQDE